MRVSRRLSGITADVSNFFFSTALNAGYLGRSFALKLCPPIVILAYRKCCRRSRPWAKAPRAASRYDTPVSAVSYCVIGTKSRDGPPRQRCQRLVALALNANDWRGVRCDAAPTFLAWG
ncbi:hypothetical protein MRX96_024304 [Rhipicephalus microplus]